MLGSHITDVQEAYGFSVDKYLMVEEKSYIVLV